MKIFFHYHLSDIGKIVFEQRKLLLEFKYAVIQQNIVIFETYRAILEIKTPKILICKQRNMPKRINSLRCCNKSNFSQMIKYFR